MAEEPPGFHGFRFESGDELSASDLQRLANLIGEQRSMGGRNVLFKRSTTGTSAEILERYKSPLHPFRIEYHPDTASDSSPKFRVGLGLVHGPALITKTDKVEHTQFNWFKVEDEDGVTLSGDTRQEAWLKVKWVNRNTTGGGGGTDGGDPDPDEEVRLDDLQNDLDDCQRYIDKVEIKWFENKKSGWESEENFSKEGEPRPEETNDVTYAYIGAVIQKSDPGDPGGDKERIIVQRRRSDFDLSQPCPDIDESYDSSSGSSSSSSYSYSYSDSLEPCQTLCIGLPDPEDATYEGEPGSYQWRGTMNRGATYGKFFNMDVFDIHGRDLILKFEEDGGDWYWSLYVDGVYEGRQLGDLQCPEEDWYGGYYISQGACEDSSSSSSSEEPPPDPTCTKVCLIKPDNFRPTPDDDDLEPEGYSWRTNATKLVAADPPTLRGDNQYNSKDLELRWKQIGPTSSKWELWHGSDFLGFRYNTDENVGCPPIGWYGSFWYVTAQTTCPPDSSSSSSSSGPPASSESSKNAMVPFRDEYIRWACMEMPQPMFWDVFDVTFEGWERKHQSKLPPEFIESCEKGSIEVVSVTCVSQPEMVSAFYCNHTNQLVSQIRRPLWRRNLVRVRIVVQGLRKGARERFLRVPEDVAKRNEAFWASAKK